MVRCVLSGTGTWFSVEKTARPLLCLSTVNIASTKNSGSSHSPPLLIDNPHPTLSLHLSDSSKATSPPPKDVRNCCV